MSPTNSFVEFDDQINCIGDRYILQPLLSSPDPSPSIQVIPDSQSEDSGCGIAPPSAVAYTSERTLADRSCTPSSPALQQAESAGQQHTQQGADSHQLPDSTHHMAASSPKSHVYATHPAPSNTSRPDTQQAVSDPQQNCSTVLTAAESPPDSDAVEQLEHKPRIQFMGMGGELISKHICCAFAAACEREGGSPQNQLACMAAFLAWRQMHSPQHPSCFATVRHTCLFRHAPAATTAQHSAHTKSGFLHQIKI